MTKFSEEQRFARLITGLAGEISPRVADLIRADAENNAFETGPATGENDPRWRVAYDTAQDISADPTRYGIPTT